MDKAIVKYLHERREDPRGVADGVDVPVWKSKGDVHDPGKYRGITLLSHVLKVFLNDSGWKDKEKRKETGGIG